MTKQEIKHKNAQLRERVISVANEYTHEDLSYMSKNSDYTPERVIKNVVNIYLTNETLKNAFLRRANKLLK